MRMGVLFLSNYRSMVQTHLAKNKYSFILHYVCSVFGHCFSEAPLVPTCMSVYILDINRLAMAWNSSGPIPGANSSGRDSNSGIL